MFNINLVICLFCLGPCPDADPMRPYRRVVPWGGKCYIFYKIEESRYTADKLCYYEDADLVSLNSEAEYEFVTNETNNFGLGDFWLSGKQGWYDFYFSANVNLHN